MATPSLVALLCRTSDRTPGGAAGTQALADALGERLGSPPRVVGTPARPRDSGWADDLRDSRGCLLEAGGQVDDALAAGRFPVLLAGDCSIALTTLPAVWRHHPDARVLWLDAHGDFNTPDTSPSGFLGGMCLAGACGVWDPGLGQPPGDPSRVVTCGVRDLDGGERVLLETAGVHTERPGRLAGSLAGERVYVHLDLDVLDPSVLPARFAAPGGLSDGGLRTLLAEVAASADVLGVEITAFEAPPDPHERAALADTLAAVVDPIANPGAQHGH